MEGGHEPSPAIKPAGRAITQRASRTSPSQAVLTCIAVLWLSAIIAGLLLHTDLTAEELLEVKQNIPFLWFDYLLRRYGTFLPFVPFAFRWWGAALSSPGQNVTPPSQFAEAGVVYIALSFARAFVYILHVTGVLHLMLAQLGIWTTSGEDKRSHLMSDHMLLGASLTAILATEIGLGLGDLKRALGQQNVEAFRLFSVLSALLLSAFLCIGTIVDMFYTARYFHGAKEIFGALFLGYILFQAPLGYWLWIGSWQKPQVSYAKRKLSE